MRIRALFFVALALVVAQTSFGATVSGSGGTASSCTNLPGAPFNINGTLYAYYDCSLYGDVSSYSFNLTSLMTEGGANLSDNEVGAGYFVVINGDPNTMTDDGGPDGLFNRSLWETVLYFPAVNVLSTVSDSLTVDWPGAFPAASTVQNYDEFLYPGFPDAGFFIQYTPPETVWVPNGPCDDDGGVPCSNEYDIYATPEPGTMLLLGSGLAMLGGVLLKKRRTAGGAA
jgi:hypothetical protein